MSLPTTAGMTTARWADVPVLDVPLDWLTSTQRHLNPAAVLAAIDEPSRSWCGDPYPHAVWHGPALLLEDGHHRVAAARLTGRRSIRARVLLDAVIDLH